MRYKFHGKFRRSSRSVGTMVDCRISKNKNFSKCWFRKSEIEHVQSARPFFIVDPPVKNES